MKITLKTVTCKQQEMEVADNASIMDIKQNLKEEYDIKSLRICFNGEVLADEVTIDTLNLTETDCFVIAGKKSKVAKAVASHQERTAQANQGAEEKPAGVVSSSNTTNSEPAPASSATPAVQPVGVNSELIDTIVAMGFDDRKQVGLALQAAYMNVERAVEYLCTGIPDKALDDSMAQAMRGNGPSEINTSQLRVALEAVPQFAEIKATYQQNREVLPVILEQMGQRYPELYTMVMANIEEFQRIMEEVSGAPGFANTADATNELADRMPEEIQITPEDRDALVQLVELGGGAWDQQAALLVYLACRKNQELAASVLLEHGGVPAELLAEIIANQGDLEGDE